MRQTSRTWSIDRPGVFTPVDMLAATITMAPGTGAAQFSRASGNTPSLRREKEAGFAPATCVLLAHSAQRS
jgi:hypothetical protein